MFQNIDSTNMRITTPAACVLFIFLFVRCSHRLAPQSYCYICCACVGVGNLQLNEGDRFVIYYEYGNRRRHEEKSYTGKGTYRQEESKLYLYFEDPPSATSEIRLIKRRASDSLLVHVTKIVDPVENDSLSGASLVLRENVGSRKVLVENYFQPRQESKDQLDLFLKRDVRKNPVMMEAYFVGTGRASVLINEPGLYNAEITLPSGHADVIFKKGDVHVYKVIRYQGVTTIRNTQNRKIFFTTEGCDCG